MLLRESIVLCVRSLILLFGSFLLSVTFQAGLRAQDALPGVHPKSLG
jgi:hypothetical protein